MWRLHSIATFGELEAVTTEAEAFEVLRGYGEELGADLVSYHHLPPPTRRGEETPTVMSAGFPSAWVRNYRENNYHRIDPVVSYATYQTRPFLVSSIGDLVDLTTEQARYVRELFAWLTPGDGSIIPVFGPSGRHGYVGMGSREAITPWESMRIRTVQAVCESFHLRFCELRLRGLPKDFELTERESDILAFMARGHADWIIGGLVGAKTDYVRMTVANILDKMNVTDRPSAILRAKGLGLIEG